MATTIANLERRRTPGVTIEQVHLRLLGAYGSYLGDHAEAVQPANVPIFRGAVQGWPEIEELERVRGTQFERVVFSLPTPTFARSIIDGRYVSRFTWQGETTCSPMRLGWVEPRLRQTWAVLPDSASESTVFHELCHLFTAPAYWSWLHESPQTEAYSFMERHTELLTIFEMPSGAGERYDDPGVDILRAWSLSRDVLARAMFGGDCQPLEEALVRGSGAPNARAAIIGYFNTLRGQEFSWDGRGDEPRGGEGDP